VPGPASMRACPMTYLSSDQAARRMAFFTSLDSQRTVPNWSLALAPWLRSYLARVSEICRSSHLASLVFRFAHRSGRLEEVSSQNKYQSGAGWSVGARQPASSGAPRRIDVARNII
jgi:hypothetical protein